MLSKRTSLLDYAIFFNEVGSLNASSSRFCDSKVKLFFCCETLKKNAPVITIAIVTMEMM